MDEAQFKPGSLPPDKPDMMAMPSRDVLLSEETWSARAGGKMLLYLGPPLKQNIPTGLAREILARRRAWAAMWTYDYDCGRETPWFSLVCDIPDYNLEHIKKKTRYYVRKGLEACQFRRIDAFWLADHGYDTYARAATRYADSSVERRENWQARMRELSRRENFEFYGVFAGEQLAAYGIAILLGSVVNVGVAKFDPSLSDSYPMYVLYYGLAHHYLTERGMRYVDNGTRPILHDTNIGEFLYRLGWRPAYGRLRLHCRLPVRAAMLIARSLRRPLAMVLPASVGRTIETLLTADDLARATAPQ